MHNKDIMKTEQKAYQNVDGQSGVYAHFDASQITLFEKALQFFSDSSLFICDEAYDNEGRKLKGVYSLRDKEHKDITCFWEKLDFLDRNRFLLEEPIVIRRDVNTIIHMINSRKIILDNGIRSRLYISIDERATLINTLSAGQIDAPPLTFAEKDNVYIVIDGLKRLVLLSELTHEEQNRFGEIVIQIHVFKGLPDDFCRDDGLAAT